MDASNMFNFYDIFRNELIGDTILFIVIWYIATNYYCLKAKVPPEVILLVNILSTAIMFEKTRIILMWAGLLLMVGFIAYNAFNKWLTR